MHYVVPKMKMVGQDMTKSCWYAAGLMLIAWREAKLQMSDPYYTDPLTIQRWGKLYDQDTGLVNSDMADYAWDMGFEMIPPQTVSPAGLQSWLKSYGPLWVNGKHHITVIAGIKGTDKAPKVLVFDPERPHKKHGEWRDLYVWYNIDGYAGPDSDASVKASFLRVA